jgi:signal transduction histidine kinase
VEGTLKARNMSVAESRLLPLVFENLFRNSAIHAGEFTRVGVSIKTDGQDLVVRVSDDGPGIADEVKNHLFERGSSTRGGGLGLYLSRRVIVSLGGSIDLGESEEGEGAVFRIVIPGSL